MDSPRCSGVETAQQRRQRLTALGRIDREFSQRFLDATNGHNGVLVVADDVLQTLRAGDEAGSRSADDGLGELGGVASALCAHTNPVQVGIGRLARQAHDLLLQLLELARSRRAKGLLDSARRGLGGEIGETFEQG
jgi:hypothetical protein